GDDGRDEESLLRECHGETCPWDDRHCAGVGFATRLPAGHGDQISRQIDAPPRRWWPAAPSTTADDRDRRTRPAALPDQDVSSWSRATARQRGARGMPRPAVAMISRCTSLTPPPNVPTGAAR